MKKLLSTSAILGALAISAGAANAANLQVNVGGFLDFQAGYTSDDVIGENADQRNEINFNNDTEVHFTVEGKSDNGLEYGAVIELEADINGGDAQDGGTNADKSFLFLQGGFGRVELGGNTGAEEALSVNTSTFASATGGVDGDFYRYVALPTDNFIIRPDLTIANSGNGAAVNEDATKITYYTPRFSGFQAGVSYTPNTDATGFTAPAAGATQFENVFAGGVNYSGQFDSVGVKAAVTGITSGDNKVAAGNADLEGFDAGVNVSFNNITVGGSYGDWLDTFGQNVDANYWDAGIGYSAGAFSGSVTYLNSEVDTDGAAAATDGEFDNLVVGVDYQLAPGLVPYVEASFFDFDGVGNVDGTDDNSGAVVLVGSELTF